MTAPNAPRTFTLRVTEHGIVLCDDVDGAVLELWHPEELAQVRRLLAGVELPPLPGKPLAS